MRWIATKNRDNTLNLTLNLINIFQSARSILLSSMSLLLSSFSHVCLLEYFVSGIRCQKLSTLVRLYKNAIFQPILSNARLSLLVTKLLIM